MDARINAANVILDRGVRFRLPAPFWKRWLGRDWVTIHHLKAGTILEISRVVVASGLENVAGMSDYEMLEKSIPACARCIAIAILNDKHRIDKGVDKLTDKLVDKISVESIVDIFMQVKQMNRVSDFTTITRYLLTMTQMMTSPKNLGHDSGS